MDDTAREVRAIRWTLWAVLGVGLLVLVVWTVTHARDAGLHDADNRWLREHGLAPFDPGRR